MTTEELKKELEELGLSLCDHGFDAPYYTVEDERGLVFAQVDHTYEYIAEVDRATFSNQEKQRKLFDAVTKYAATPISEREPKRYFKYRLKPISNEFDGFLYYLNYDADFCVFFLKSGNVSGKFQTIFEENDPLLKGVNLKLFVAEEVDQEGNELHD